MRILSKVFWMAMLLILLPMAGQAQEALLENLYSQVFELYDQGRYSEAADIAKEALKVAENTFGEDHPNVAISLNNLAYLYDCQGNHAQSGPLYRRALGILEKAVGPDHFKVALCCVIWQSGAGRLERKMKLIGWKRELKTFELTIRTSLLLMLTQLKGVILHAQIPQNVLTNLLPRCLYC